METEPWKLDENWEEAEYLGAVRTLLLVSGYSGCSGANSHNNLSTCGLFFHKNRKCLKKQSYLACYCSYGLETGYHSIDRGRNTSAADKYLI